jgi:hypothetical protein
MRLAVAAAMACLILCKVTIGPGDARAADAAGGAPSPTAGSSPPQPAPMPTYPDASGHRIPLGACAATLDGRVWVLPCNDPAVAVARQRTARQAARRAAGERVRQAAVGGGGDLLLGGLIGGIEARRRRGNKGCRGRANSLRF